MFGADLCINSLSLGQRFKSSHGIDSTAFLQMNLFRPAFRPESFDLVVCNGELHHTSDPELGLRSISKLVKKGGLIVIGLYNRYGRLTTDLRRVVFRASGDRFKSLDPRLRDRENRRGTSQYLVHGPIQTPSRVKAHLRTNHEMVSTIGVRVRKQYSQSDGI